MTSHSPLLVNFFEPGEVHILGRLANGAVETFALSSLNTVQKGLEYFGGGELWAMMDRETIQREINQMASDRTLDQGDGSRLDRFKLSAVSDFMFSGGDQR